MFMLSETMLLKFIGLDGHFNIFLNMQQKLSQYRTKVRQKIWYF